jgi:peroxiredoxin
MADEVVQRLAACEVLDPEGQPSRLGAQWADRPVVLVIIRHFACMFCKEQLADFKPFVPRIREAGGETVVLGHGAPEAAKWFIEDYDIGAPVFVDTERKAYQIVDAKRPTIPPPQTFLAMARALRKGFRQTKSLGDARQLGGVFVITPGGEMPYKYLSKFAGDHPDPAKPLAIVKRLQKSS